MLQPAGNKKDAGRHIVLKALESPDTNRQAHAKDVSGSPTHRVHSNFPDFQNDAKRILLIGSHRKTNVAVFSFTVKYYREIIFNFIHLARDDQKGTTCSANSIWGEP